MTKNDASPCIALALGSGASRGWSHIGVINALADAGIEPTIVCGTSVGAIVGGAYVTGNLKKLEDWVLNSKLADVLGFFDLKFSQAGFVSPEKMNRFLHEFVAAEDIRIEDLEKPYVAVATDLESGREVWLKEGNLANAIRASMALPGLFAAVRNDNRWLVDGGLVNPVPVSACRALGADCVIGVNLNFDIVGKHFKTKAVDTAEEPKQDEGVLDNLKRQALGVTNSLFGNNNDESGPPGLFSAVSSSINIFQYRITRSRMAGDPADVLISPRLGDIGILEFQKAAEAIAEGEECVHAALPELRRIIDAST